MPFGFRIAKQWASMIDRRAFNHLLSAAAATALFAPAGVRAAVTRDSGAIRTFDDLKGHARTLAARPYAPPAMTASRFLKGLSPEQFQKIRFNPERALWRGLSDYEVHFIKPGVYANDLVALNALHDGHATTVGYDLSDFHLQDIDAAPEDARSDGFGGFKVVYPLHPEHSWKDELVVFHGASYFRFLGRRQQYGLSARGIAVNTALPRDEEFPLFREFWLSQPDPGAQSLALLALLDGPSLCGAYRFEIEPGNETAVTVEAELTLRRDVEKLGCAPLTSMFLNGHADRTADAARFPRHVHDSDGLALELADGDAVWRPLARRRGVTITQHFANDPKGFGLLQRENDPALFDTPEKRYHARPGYWVEPLMPLGRGHVQLVEIESIDVDFDNIAAFWVPDDKPVPGAPFPLHYRLTAVAGNPMTWTSRGFARTGGVIPLDLTGKGPYLRAAVRFSGETVRTGGALEAKVTSPHGAARDLSVTRRPDGDVDVAFDFQASDSEKAEIFVSLRRDGRRVSETWSYLWTA